MMMRSLTSRPLLVTALLSLSSVWADLNVVSPDLNTVDTVAEARDGQSENILSSMLKLLFADHGHGHGHAHAHDHASNSLAEEADPSAAGYYNQYYDPAYAQNYYQKYDMARINKMGQVCVHCSYQDPNYQLGYRFSDYADDELVEKQGGGGPTPADFIPFIASFSLPLTAALVTFVAIITVYIWEHRIRHLQISPQARMRRSYEGIVILDFS